MMNDDIDAMVALLASIAKQNGVSGDTITNITNSTSPQSTRDVVNKTVNNTKEVQVGADTDEIFTNRYFSSGESPVVLDEDEFVKFQFGFQASTINLRCDGDIVVAFESPNDHGNRIKLTASETPFSIGGETPIGANGVYVMALNPANKPNLQIIAY